MCCGGSNIKKNYNNKTGMTREQRIRANMKGKQIKIQENDLIVELVEVVEENNNVNNG